MDGIQIMILVFWNFHFLPVFCIFFLPFLLLTLTLIIPLHSTMFYCWTLNNNLSLFHTHTNRYSKNTGKSSIREANVVKENSLCLPLLLLSPTLAIMIATKFFFFAIILRQISDLIKQTSNCNKCGENFNFWIFILYVSSGKTKPIWRKHFINDHCERKNIRLCNCFLYIWWIMNYICTCVMLVSA